MMKGSGAGYVLVTNGSGCGSGRPKNIRIRIHNTGVVDSVSGAESGASPRDPGWEKFGSRIILPDIESSIPELFVFGPPGSVSVNILYGFGSFRQQAKQLF